MSSLTLAVGLVAVAVACGLSGRLIQGALRERRRDAQVLGLLATFGPVMERAHTEPRTLLTWHPLAVAARQSFPEAFASLDGDGAHRFPFGSALLETAHATWTADWLTWEGEHDAEFRRRAAMLEAKSGDTDPRDIRAGHDLLEREQLERYQRQYETYVKVSKALAALADTPVES
jgi:hypothetical protein